MLAVVNGCKASNTCHWHFMYVLDVILCIKLSQTDLVFFSEGISYFSLYFAFHNCLYVCGQGGLMYVKCKIVDITNT